MPFQMGYTAAELSGGQPVPNNWYNLQFIKFRPKVSSKGDSFNYNAELEVVQNPEFEGRRVFVGLNNKAGFIIAAFVHAFGLEMEQDPSNPEEHAIPGAFLGSKENPEHPELWNYQGPLKNKICEAEIFTDEFNGKKSNKIKQFKCAVTGCTERHPTNLK